MAEQPALGFGGLLPQLRAEARLTQEDLAEAAGPALGLAEPVRAVFVAAARWRTPAAEVPAAVRRQGSPASEGPAPGGEAAWSGRPHPGP